MFENYPGTNKLSVFQGRQVNLRLSLEWYDELTSKKLGAADGISQYCCHCSGWQGLKWSCFEEIEYICIFYHLLILKWHRQLKSLPIEDKGLCILCCQYHGCWWHGDTKNQPWYWPSSSKMWTPTSAPYSLVQGTIWVWDQPMKDDVTMSLAGHIYI